jgi:hypothetical protein
LRRGESHSLTDLLDRLAEGAEGETVTLGDLLGQVGRRAYGPLLFVPAVLAAGPTGVVPGMAVVTATLIALVAGQMLLPLDQPWLPRRLLGLKMRRALFDRALAKTRTAAEWTDRFIKARWVVLAQPPVTYAVAAVCLMLAGLMFPFALVPFAVTLPGAAIAFFALGITFRDGVLIAIGLAVAAGAAGLAAWLIA